MIPRASFAAILAALSIVACAAIDPPASFEKPEAGGETRSDAGAYERCRLLDRRFVTDVQARLYGDAPGPQAVCVTLQLPVRGAGTGAVVFCVAGVLERVAVPSVHDLTADLRSCAYCAYVQTNCTTAEAAASPTCETSYAVLSGRVRIVRLSGTPDASVWIDIGELEVARVTRRDETQTDVERRDCLFADGLTLQGKLVPRSAAGCSGLEESACTIANSAASRVP